MTIGDYNGGHRSSWRELFRRWTTVDHLCGVAVIGFVVFASVLLFAAYANHLYVLHWAVATSLKYIDPGVMTANSADLAKLEAGAKVFDSARSQLLSTDAITFLITLMSVVVFTMIVKLFSGAEKNLRQAEMMIREDAEKIQRAENQLRVAEQRINQAHQATCQLALFIGAISASLSATTLTGTVDRNLDRLANELAVPTAPDEGIAVASVMSDWLKSLKTTLTDPNFIEIGIPGPMLSALHEGVAQIEGQLKTMNMKLERVIHGITTEIGDLVRDWLVSSNAPEPHDLEDGIHRLHVIASHLQKLRADASNNVASLAAKIKLRLTPHERRHYAALMTSVETLQRLDADLQRTQTNQIHLHRLQQTVKECREALHEELCQHWEEFNETLSAPKP